MSQHYVIMSHHCVAGVEVSQVFSLKYDTNWNDSTSEERRKFDSSMKQALAPLYDLLAQYRDIEIISVQGDATGSRRKRALTKYVHSSRKLCFTSCASDICMTSC